MQRRDGGLQRVAQLAHQAHVLALDGEVRGVHLDELAQEDLRAGVGFAPEPLDVGDGGADQVVHELELAPDRRAELFELGGLGRA